VLLLDVVEVMRLEWFYLRHGPACRG
jgi:hypothetical protein